MVLIAHTSGRINGGWVGVEVFFVLSGFLITTLLVQEHQRSGEIRLGRFYERRARRLLPALVATVVVAGIFVAIDEKSRDATVAYAWAGLGALLFANNWLGATGAIADSSLSHTWSLAEEEQFYLLWPVLLWLGMRRGMRLGTMLVATAAVTVLLAGWRVAAWRLFTGPSDRIDFGADTRALGLLLGCVLALAFTNNALRHRIASLTRPLAVPLLALLVIGYAWTDSSLSQRTTIVVGLTLVDIATAILIAHLMLNTSLTMRLFDNTPAVWVGQRSYAIYLYHFPIVALAIDDVNRVSFFASDLAQTLFVLSATLALAALSYRYIEQPFRGHGRRPVTAPTPTPACHHPTALTPPTARQLATERVRSR